VSRNSRDDLIRCALTLLHDGRSVSLDSVADAAGLTKPGLMYHFKTKRDLMLALVDAVVDDWLTSLEELLPTAAGDASPWDRHRAYVDLAIGRRADVTDLVFLTDPRLREPLAARWAERLGPWFAIPDTISSSERGRLGAARLMADGIWFADATNTLTPTTDERAEIRALAHHLLEN